MAQVETAVAARPAAFYPSILRRLASVLYESLLLAALLLGGAFLFSGLLAALNAIATGSASITPGPVGRLALQAGLVVLVGAYFVRSWVRGGQTLAMKAWRLRLVRPDGAPVGTGRAIARYLITLAIVGTGAIAAAVLWKRPATLLAWVALLPSVADVAWAVFDRERQFMHDRLTGTRIVGLERGPPKSAA